MPENTFNTPAGQTIARELMIAYLNTGTKEAPVWSPFGKRTSDSSIDYDWGEDTSKDILGNTWTTMKKPTMTQGFDPWDLDGGDAAQQKIYQLADHTSVPVRYVRERRRRPPNPNETNI